MLTLVETLHPKEGAMKFLAFFLLGRMLFGITGNPVLAIIIVFVVIYLLDRRFIGLTPSALGPMRRQLRARTLQRDLSLNPHDTSAKLDLASIYVLRRQYHRALTLLESLPPSIAEEPEVLYEKGVCILNLTNVSQGEELILSALQKNPNLHYGDPYLKLATALASKDPARAMEYLSHFQAMNYSSCESEYRMGGLLARLGDRRGAKEAYRRCLETYRSLPPFRKRTERRYALLAWFKRMS